MNSTDYVRAYRQLTDDGRDWFALRLFGTGIYALRDFLGGHGYATFIPERQVDSERGGHRHEELRPVVSNLLYVRRLGPHADDREENARAAEGEARELLALLSSSPMKAGILRPYPAAPTYATITSREMREFMMLCNPQLTYQYFLEGEADDIWQKGRDVYIAYGPLRGATGRLVRKNKEYFLLKNVPGFQVMVQVSRWVCRPLNTSGE